LDLQAPFSLNINRIFVVVFTLFNPHQPSERGLKDDSMMKSTVGMIISVLTLGILIAVPSATFAWNLTHLASYRPPSAGELIDVEISGDLAFVSAGLGGLAIIDISDPSAPAYVANYWIGAEQSWCAQGDYLYGSERYSGITVVDVSTPSAPVHVTDYRPIRKSYEHADGNGDYLFAATHTDGVEIIDISTPSSPQYVSEIATENAWAVDEFGGLLYVADGASGLKVIDVSIPEQPQLLGAAQASGTAKDVVVWGDCAFVSVGAFGVDMFDVSDPLQPALLANYNTTGYASRVAVTDSLIAVSDWDDVEVLRWDDSPSLSLVGYKSTGGRVMGVNMVDDVIYSAEWFLFRTFQFGSTEGPDLDLSVRVLDFPHAETDSCLDTTLYLTNNGETELTLLSADVDHADFTFSLPKTTIAPGEIVEGTVTYCATGEDAQGRLTLQTNDPDEDTVSITLRGNTPWGVEAGELAPDFTLSSVNGFGNITLSDLLGKVVLISFFASW
jgi:hypothetical protein